MVATRPLALTKILTAIFEDKVESLTSTQEGLRRLVCLLLSLTKRGRQFSDLLAAIYPFTSLEPRDFVERANAEVCARGLAVRVWFSAREETERVWDKVSHKLSGAPDEVVLAILTSVARGELEPDDAATLSILAVLSQDYFALKDAISKPAVLSDGVLSAALAPDISAVVSKLKSVIERWHLPRDLMSLASEQATKLTVRTVAERLIQMRSTEDLLAYPDFTLLLFLLSLPNEPSGQLSVELVRSLVDVMRVSPLPVEVITFLCRLLRREETMLAEALMLSAVRRRHGLDVFHRALDRVFSGCAELAVALDVALDHLTERERLTLWSLASRDVRAVKHLDEALRGAGAPRTVILGIPWELEMSKDALEREVRRAVAEYEREKVTPPEMLKRLNIVISALSQARASVRERSLANLVGAMRALAECEEEISALSTKILEVSGREVKVLRELALEARDLRERVERALEHAIFTEYPSIVRGRGALRRVCDVSSLIGSLKPPVILVVIDGLRLDDYYVRLRRELVTYGFRVVREEVLVSLLPSITLFSRRAIFAGRIPDIFTPFSDVRMPPEEALLSATMGPSLFVSGSLEHVRLTVRKLPQQELSRVRVVAIVLSELEKAAHGSPEAYLARMPKGFAHEVAALVRDVAEFVRQVRGRCTVVVTADHGLCDFPEITDVNVRVFRYLARKRGLDPALRPIEHPRYAAYPLISRVELDASLHEVRRICGSEAYAVPATELGIQRVAFLVRRANVPSVISAERVLFVFPRGKRRFRTREMRQVVLHGGPHPVEVLVPFGVFEV